MIYKGILVAVTLGSALSLGAGCGAPSGDTNETSGRVEATDGGVVMAPPTPGAYRRAGAAPAGLVSITGLYLAAPAPLADGGAGGKPSFFMDVTDARGDGAVPADARIKGKYTAANGVIKLLNEGGSGSAKWFGTYSYTLDAGGGITLTRSPGTTAEPAVDAKLVPAVAATGYCSAAADCSLQGLSHASCVAPEYGAWSCSEARTCSWPCAVPTVWNEQVSKVTLTQSGVGGGIIASFCDPASVGAEKYSLEVVTPTDTALPTTYKFTWDRCIAASTSTSARDRDWGSRPITVEEFVTIKAAIQGVNVSAIPSCPDNAQTRTLKIVAGATSDFFDATACAAPTGTSSSAERVYVDQTERVFTAFRALPH